MAPASLWRTELAIHVHEIYSMQSNSPRSEPAFGLTIGPGERRKSPRFDMQFPVLLRAMGDPWTLTHTADVSAAGALFVTEKPFLLNSPIEYLVTFPPDLTKAPQPLRVRFFGAVLRCERVSELSGSFGVAVRNTAHRYLTLEEASNFDALEQKLSLSPGSADVTHARRSGT